MAWIESHTVLIRHKKLKMMANELRLKPVYLMGHLHALWHAALEQQEDGDLSSWNDDLIAELSEYAGDAPRFVSLLQKHGWLDGKLIHDWMEYVGRYLENKYRTANPEKLISIKLKHSQTTDGLKSDFSQTKDRPPNQPKPTIPNLTNHKVLNVHPSFDFEAIWKKYPKQVGKKHAVRHFKATVKTDQDYANINIAMANYLKSERVFKDYVQNGSTWFNQWQDWVDFKEDVCPTCKGNGKYTSSTGYESVCSCPKGKSLRLSKN